MKCFFSSQLLVNIALVFETRNGKNIILSYLKKTEEKTILIVKISISKLAVGDQLQKK